jgi:hypothetical protein
VRRVGPSAVSGLVVALAILQLLPGVAAAAAAASKTYWAPLFEIAECFHHKSSAPSRLDAWGQVTAPAGWLASASRPNPKRQRCDVDTLYFTPKVGAARCLQIQGSQDAQDNTLGRPISLRIWAAAARSLNSVRGSWSHVYDMPRSSGMAGRLAVEGARGRTGVSIEFHVAYLSKDRREFYELALFPVSTRVAGCTASDRKESVATARAIARSFRVVFRGPRRETTPGPPLAIPFYCFTNPLLSESSCPPAHPFHPPASFCKTHRCIPNFWQGHGYVVQCVDGEWSHSGGLPGACSDHGGETANPPPPTRSSRSAATRNDVRPLHLAAATGASQMGQTLELPLHGH